MIQKKNFNKSMLLLEIQNIIFWRIFKYITLFLTYFWEYFFQKINSDLGIVFLDSGSQWILKELTPRAKKAISHDHYYIGVLLSRQTKLIIEVEKLIFPTANASG